MAYPFLVDETFDAGDRGNFDSETDASSILDFPHYAALARQGLAPWRGAHALRLRLSGTATANITETGGFDTAVGSTISVWFPVCIGADLDLNDGDAVILFALQSAGAVNEVVFGVDRSGANYRLFAGETGATNTLVITRSNKRWYQVELTCSIAAGTGTIDFYIDGAAVGAQIASLTQADITQGQLGAISGTAAGNAGTILIGGVVADDLRVYPRIQFPVDTAWVTRDQTCFIGPCRVDNVVVTGTATDAVLTILDADIFESTGIAFSREPSIYIRNVVANEQSPGYNSPIEFKRGVYVQLTGTNPQAWISLVQKSDYGAVVRSHANYVDRGLRHRGLI